MANLINQNKFKFLADQIKDIEWRLLNHQRIIDFRAHILVRKIYQQITEPSSLLLAGGIGFIIGDLTKRRIAKVPAATDKAAGSKVSPLTVALNLLTSVRTLYTALPVAWIMKSRRYQRGASSRASQRKYRPEPASGTLYDRRKPKYGSRLQPTR